MQMMLRLFSVWPFVLHGAAAHSAYKSNVNRNGEMHL